MALQEFALPSQSVLGSLLLNAPWQGACVAHCGGAGGDEPQRCTLGLCCAVDHALNCHSGAFSYGSFRYDLRCLASGQELRRAVHPGSAAGPFRLPLGQLR